MRAKWILNGVLGLFVVVALALVARQTMSGRTPSAAVPVPPGVTATVASMAAATVSEQPVTATAVPDPVAAVPVARAQAPTIPVGRASAAPTQKPVTKDPPVTARDVPRPGHKVIAMYFHGDIRCTTCRKVEAYAKEAVEEGFREQVAAGGVEFRAVNVEQPENRHFIQDYQLTNKSVVVVDEVGSSVTRWVKLDNVWGLVGNRDAYLLYVQDAVRAYVEN